MIRLTSAVVFAVLASASSFAAERTVTLTVQKMMCDVCTSAVKRSLEALPGVSRAQVSLQNKTAVVTYDDERTDLNALIDATTKAGYPSEPKN